MRYAWTTVVHKWFVFLACLKIGVPLWRAIIHDLSKFTPAELPHYHRQFFGDKSDPDGFARAWLHHIHHNPHHWQHWILPDKFTPKDSNILEGILPMPEIYVREMVAIGWGLHGPILARGICQIG